MSDAVLNLLKLCLLALIYLFLARVVWVVTRELRSAPAPVGGPAAPPRVRPAEPTTPSPPPTPTAPITAHRLAVRHGDGGTTEAVVSGEATIGRGAGCTLTLTDTFASQVHARLVVTAAGLRVEDLGSTNGTTVNGNRISGPVDLRPGDTIGIGRSTIEVLG